MYVVFYWNNEAQTATWREARFGGALDTCKTQTELVSYLNGMGFVAKRGTTSVGPPEGPPSNADFRAIG